MPAKESTSRRKALMDKVNEPEKLDPTPIEVPLDAKAQGTDIEELIQKQIALHIAKKKPGA